MKPTAHDIKIMELIKTFRTTMCIKQLTVAAALNMPESTYSKIEAGKLAVPTGQVELICNAIGLNHVKIIALAKAYKNVDCRVGSWAKVLITFIKTTENKHEKDVLENTQLEDAINSIKAVELYMAEKI